MNSNHATYSCKAEKNAQHDRWNVAPSSPPIANHATYGCKAEKNARLQGGVWRQRHTLRAATTAKAKACLAPMESRFTMPPKDLKATSCAAGAAAQHMTTRLKVEVEKESGGGEGGAKGDVDGRSCVAWPIYREV